MACLRMTPATRAVAAAVPDKLLCLVHGWCAHLSKAVQPSALGRLHRRFLGVAFAPWPAAAVFDLAPGPAAAAGVGLRRPRLKAYCIDMHMTILAWQSMLGKLVGICPAVSSGLLLSLGTCLPRCTCTCTVVRCTRAHKTSQVFTCT